MNEFGEELWGKVREDLPALARGWWDENREPLIKLGRSEVIDTIRALRRSKNAAKLEVVARMTPDQWVAYRDGTTAQLVEISKRRAKLIAALEDLGWLIARLVGRYASESLAGVR